MEAESLSADDLAALIDAHFEWLVVRENGGSFALRKTEIDVVDAGPRTLLEFLDESGYRTVKVASAAAVNEQLVLDISSQFGRESEQIRLVPRTSAKELSLNIELARLEKANEIAGFIREGFPEIKIARIALNTENGRLAQIGIQTGERTQAVALADITGTLPPELLLTTAATLLRNLQDRRNKPVTETWIVCEKRQARTVRKLHALLNEREKARFKIVEISRKTEPVKAVEMRHHKLTDLWREKPKKLVLPPNLELSRTAREVIDLDPERIDVVFSKQGETLRFLGLPFARVRRLLGRERAWFGVERNRRPLDAESWTELGALIAELRLHRSPDANRRHEFFRAAPEAWLESILRRNIGLLDSNLILSPLYNQFRASADKIDLLAIRKDGRLVIVELKTGPDRETVFQAADYWRKIELQRRKGELQRLRAFGDMEILAKPALVYVAAPALSFHRDFDHFARMIAKEIELWRFELHEGWRSEIKVLARKSVNEEFS